MDTLDELFSADGLPIHEWNKQRLTLILVSGALTISVGVSMALSNVFAFPFQTSTVLAGHPIQTDTLTQTKAMLQNIHQLNSEVEHQLLISKKSDGDAVTMAGVEEGEGNTFGRNDPFAPLVQKPSTAAGSTSLNGNSALPPLPSFSSSGLSGSSSFKMPSFKPTDVLEDMEYTGMIDGDKANATVALIKVHDAFKGTKTLVLKAGEAFTVNGKRMVLRSISSNGVSLRIGKNVRYKSLKPFEDNITSSLGARLVPAPTELPEATENQTTKQTDLQGLKE